MSAAIGLRGDFDAARLRGIAKKAKDGPQARRLLTLASIHEGATRTGAARIGGVTVQIVRDWVVRLSAVRCSSLSLDAWPGALRLRSPSGPRALNFTTQSRTICTVTPPIFAASVRVAPA